MSLPTLYHYSNRPVLLDKEKTYNQNKSPWNKPSGIWVSHNECNGWLHTCLVDGFRVENLESCHEVVLAPTANFIILESDDDKNRFINTYYKKEDGAYWIDWERVTRDYDGFYVTHYDDHIVRWKFPKQKRAEFQPTLWYDTLGCDSGCIWNMNAIDCLLLANKDAYREQ